MADKVKVYTVWRDWRSDGPRVVEAEAVSTAKSYRLDSYMTEFRHRKVLDKREVYLSAVEAARAYAVEAVENIEKLERQLQEARALKNQAVALLAKVENEAEGGCAVCGAREKGWMCWCCQGKMSTYDCGRKCG